MAPKQVIAEGAVTLADGGSLPRSTYNSEVERLMAEALHAGAGNLARKWTKRRIHRDIVNVYGQVCWKCELPISQL